MRTVDQRVIVPDEAARRVASGVVLAQGEERGLLAHGVADNHVHALLLTHRDAAGRFAHDVETSLRWRLGIAAPFEPALIKPIRSQNQLTTTFWYILGQDERHGIVADPMHDGTSLLDVIGGRAFLVAMGPGGTRRLGAGLGRTVALALPRVRGRDLLARVGGVAVLDELPDPVELADAAAAAVGAIDLRANGPVEAAAACAAVHVASAHRTTTLADALGLSRRSVTRHRQSQPIGAVMNAVSLQWRMRAFRRHEAEHEARALVAVSHWVTAQDDALIAVRP